MTIESQLEAHALKRMNDERRALGLQGYARDGGMDAVAQAHSRVLAQKLYTQPDPGASTCRSRGTNRQE